MILAILSMASASVEVADHVGEPVGDEVVWSSTYHLAPGERCATLRVPAGSTTEVCAEWPGGIATLRTTQPFPDDTIRVPIAEGAVQRVRLKRATLRPEGLVKAPFAWASAGVSQKDRRVVDRTLDGRMRKPRAGALYVDPYQVPAGGIPGEVAASAASRGVLAGVAVIFLAVLALGWVAHRGLQVLARRERVERWLEDPDVVDELARAGVSSRD